MLHRLHGVAWSELVNNRCHFWMVRQLRHCMIPLCIAILFVMLAIPVNFLQALSLKCWASSLADHYRHSLAFSGV